MNSLAQLERTVVADRAVRQAEPFALQFTQGLHRSLQTSPDAVATLCEGRQRSFRILADRVARLGGALRALGVTPGDPVAILSFNSDVYLEFYLAAPWIGALVVPLNFRWGREELIFGLNDCAARVLLVGDGFEALIPAIRAACPAIAHVIHCGTGTRPDACLDLETLIRDHDPVPDLMRGGDQTFGIFYTGGTTGRSKGVLLSHANILSSAMGILGEGIFAEGAIGLHSAPMFHLADLMATSCLLLRGGTHVMLPTFRPHAVCELIEAHRITDLLMVPTMAQMLLEHPGFTTLDKDSLRSLLYGASPASEALIQRALAMMPRMNLAQVYGMTEVAATISMLRPADHRNERGRARLRSAGRSFCHSRVRVAALDGTEAAVGEVGEILVRGPMVMQGYLGMPEATAEALRDGWLRTGDLGYIDEGGYVFVVDRFKDMIISGGENIFSIEVENAIASHPAVAGVGVIGVPSEQWGEAVHAVVVARDNALLTLEDLIAHCRERIAGFKVPRSMELVPSLPISSAGKLLKTELRQRWKERSGNADADA